MSAALRARDVSGALRVADGYGGTLSSCTWTVAQASAETAPLAVLADGPRGREAVARCGVQISPPCAIDAAAALPRLGVVGLDEPRLALAGPCAWGFTSNDGAWSGYRAGEPWYAPSAVPGIAASTWRRGYYSSHRYYDQSAAFTAGPGAWYYATPP